MILLPLIHVELVSATEHFTTTALLDSGATLSFIPYEMAEILGLIPTTKPTPIPVSTAGGTSRFFPVRLERLSLLVGGKIFSDFSDVSVLVPTRPEHDLPYVILGRDTIFTRFHVTFKEKVKKFVLVHHKWAQ